MLQISARSWICRIHGERSWTSAKKLRSSVKQSEFVYGRGVFTDTLRTTLEADDKSNEGLLMDDGVYKRLDPSIQMTLVDGRYRFAAFSQLVTR